MKPEERYFLYPSYYKVLNSVTYRQLGYLQLEHRHNYVGCGIG
jgi:hypothetical protein